MIITENSLEPHPHRSIMVVDHDARWSGNGCCCCCLAGLPRVVLSRWQRTCLSSLCAALVAPPAQPPAFGCVAARRVPLRSLLACLTCFLLQEPSLKTIHRSRHRRRAHHHPTTNRAQKSQSQANRHVSVVSSFARPPIASRPQPHPIEAACLPDDLPPPTLSILNLVVACPIPSMLL